MKLVGRIESYGRTLRGIRKMGAVFLKRFCRCFKAADKEATYLTTSTSAKGTWLGAPSRV